MGSWNQSEPCFVQTHVYSIVALRGTPIHLFENHQEPILDTTFIRHLWVKLGNRVLDSRVFASPFLNTILLEWRSPVPCGLEWHRRAASLVQSLLREARLIQFLWNLKLELDLVILGQLWKKLAFVVLINWDADRDTRKLLSEKFCTYIAIVFLSLNKMLTLQLSKHFGKDMDKSSSAQEGGWRRGGSRYVEE